jgi:hypothetical protein
MPDVTMGRGFLASAGLQGIARKTDCNRATAIFVDAFFRRDGSLQPSITNEA